MLGVLLAAFISGPRPVARPLATAVRSASGEAIKAASVEVRRPLDKTEGATPLERLLQGFPLASTVPAVIKPDFNNGPAAALSVKF